MFNLNTDMVMECKTTELTDVVLINWLCRCSGCNKFSVITSIL